MSQVATRPVAASADSAVARVRHPAAKGRSDEKADADFGKHIDGMAGGDEAGAKAVPAMMGESQRPTARWLPLRDGEPLMLLLDEAPVTDLEMPEAASSAVAEMPTDGASPLPSPMPTSTPTLLVSDLAAAAASVAAGPVAARPVGADAMPRASAVQRLVAAALPAIPAESPEASVAPEELPQSELRADASKTHRTPGETHRTPDETPRRAHDVFVVERQTHLPPAALPAMRAGPPSERAMAQTRSVSAVAVPEAKPSDSVPDVGADTKAPVQPAAHTTAGEKDSGQRLAKPSPGRLLSADAGPRVQAQTAGEAVFDAAQPIQAAARVGQDDQPAPQVSISLLRQVVGAVVADLSPPRDAGSITPVSTPSVSPAPEPLKVVTIQLSPAELGTLTVRIALKNDALELQVETSRRETARLVDSDRDTLSNLLRSAGYHVETLTVRAVEQPAPIGAAGATPGSPDAAPQSQSGGSQADQRSTGGRAHPGQDREGHGTRQNNTGDESSLRHRAGRGLYV